MRVDKMMGYHKGTEHERSHRFRRLAERALERYGLEAAQLTLLSRPEDIIFLVEMPVRDGRAIHPYLGRIEGKRFALRVMDAGERNTVAALSEMAWLATLLRDTDLRVPEPVPASDGSLVVEVEIEGLAPAQCALVRWAWRSGGGDNSGDDVSPEDVAGWVGDYLADLRRHSDGSSASSEFEGPSWPSVPWLYERMADGSEANRNN